ncbi:MAG: hypothetical protein O2800_01785 [Planctomycetota bacterium]|nr:hypothetical protein [Planctomycetota bacterium]
MRTDSGFDVGSFSAICGMSGVAIGPGDRYVAALVEAESEDRSILKRIDIAQSCWTLGTRPPALIAYWSAVAPTSDSKKIRLVDDATLLEVVARFGESDDPRRLAYRWVLALLLLRRRILKHQGIRRDDEGCSWWSFQQRGQDGAKPFEVLDPGLRDEQLSDLSEQLAEVLATDG